MRLRSTVAVILWLLSAGCGPSASSGRFERDCPKWTAELLREIVARSEPVHAWLQAERDGAGAYPRELPEEFADLLRVGQVDGKYWLGSDETQYSLRVGDYGDCFWCYTYYSGDEEWRIDT